MQHCPRPRPVNATDDEVVVQCPGVGAVVVEGGLEARGLELGGGDLAVSDDPDLGGRAGRIHAQPQIRRKASPASDWSTCLAVVSASLMIGGRPTGGRSRSGGGPPSAALTAGAAAHDGARHPNLVGCGPPDSRSRSFGASVGLDASWVEGLGDGWPGRCAVVWMVHPWSTLLGPLPQSTTRKSTGSMDVRWDMLIAGWVGGSCHPVFQVSRTD